MKISYITTILAIYTLIMLIHKTEKKQNIISWLAISSILIICYNILICLICTFIGVLCTLTNLSICNTITIAILSTILFKTKKIQKYQIKALDIIFSILILIIVVFIGYKQYGFPFNIKYSTTDGSSHYYFAEQFYEKSTLLYKADVESLYSISSMAFKLPAAYINEGIMFKLFDNYMPLTDLFVIWDLIILYISGILMYGLLNTFFKEDKKLRILACIFSIIYMLGYQVNSMIYGYVYLSVVLDLVIAILFIMRIYKKDAISEMVALAILGLLSFGIFFSYGYFVPIIYISIIIYLIFEAKLKKEKIFSEDNLARFMSIIVIPLILGVTYFIILPIAEGSKTEISTIGVKGFIYENFISNFVVLIPILITGIVIFIKNIKKEEKKVDLTIILFILALIFLVILFIGNKIEKISDYYYYKAYYIIWPLALINVFNVISKISKDENKILKIITYIYISIFLIAITVATILNKNIWINDIFYHNVQEVVESPYIFRREEKELLLKMKSKIYENEVAVLTPKTKGRIKWSVVFHKNKYLFTDQGYYKNMTIDKWLNEKGQKYYFAFYRDYNQIEDKNETINENSEKYEILYNDEWGFLLERK